MLPLTMGGCLASKPADVGNGPPLAPCPDSPNCVSTLASDATHAMRPIPFHRSAGAALENARRAALLEPRTRLISEGPGYLYLEARSRILRFVDDVEIVVDDTARVVHFRSASRVGRSDMGVNRARMMRFTERFQGLDAPQADTITLPTRASR